MTDLAQISKGGNYLALPYNFDRIAQVIQSGRAVMLGARFNPGEWRQAEVKTTPGGKYGHAFTGVDYCIWKGKKAIVFDNSWGYDWGFDGQGVLTEDEKNGLIGAWHHQELKNNWRDDPQWDFPKPKYNWERDLMRGMRNYDVSMLQRALMYEGLFPYETPATGYFGSITYGAVVKFQEKYADDVLKPLGLEKGTGMVAELTRKKLNELFA